MKFDIDKELNDLVLFRKNQIKVEENLSYDSLHKAQIIKMQQENDEAFNKYIEDLIREIQKIRNNKPEKYFGVTYRKLINYINGMKQHRH